MGREAQLLVSPVKDDKLGVEEGVPENLNRVPRVRLQRTETACRAERRGKISMRFEGGRACKRGGGEGWIGGRKELTIASPPEPVERHQTARDVRRVRLADDDAKVWHLAVARVDETSLGRIETRALDLGVVAFDDLVVHEQDGRAGI